MAKLYVITGPAGVGKSTVTNHLSKSLLKCAVLEGDEIYHQVKSGVVKPWQEGNHVDLMWKNILCLAENYLVAGHDVIINYIIYKENFDKICERFSDFEINFVVLMANTQTIKSRDTLRGEEYAVNRVDKHINKFLSQDYSKKYFMYNDDLSVEEEVKEILTGKFKV